MKIRNGFVSNSSSSSFVVIVERDLHNLVLDKIKKSYRKDINESFKAVNLLGKDVLMFDEIIHNSDDLSGKICEYMDQLDVLDEKHANSYSSTKSDG